MNKLFILLNTIILVIGSYSVFSSTYIDAEAKNSTKNTGDTLSLNGIDKNGTKLLDLGVREEEKVKRQMSLIEKKDKLFKFSNDLTISSEEIKLLARLVHAEAKGEPYVGKVAVATVVLNRVEHHQFPDTVKEVIFEKNAFEPVLNGSINEPADKEAYKAVHDALADQGKDQGINEELLYFYNPETATSDWILTRKVVKTIGNHAFAI
ncbi:N-acetylmuramoyl-L-alanine amidase [Bacillus oleivorans]|uniref:N-acetylmuramoyl-L-alanine amidase n=1 Tax=Bacillus oleivorans TaxID=1448271 RepID=A0A285CTQ6_9BACI|nr:cell wall hydrolase [Bacillus oleivorans]SNX70894.1 N-acetylmuramoyl-L-alanine amidase [Bacillus oleivorans]